LWWGVFRVRRFYWVQAWEGGFWGWNEKKNVKDRTASKEPGVGSEKVFSARNRITEL